MPVAIPTRPLADPQWSRQVAATLLALDGSIDLPEAEAIATSLCERPRWRALSPTAAAQKAAEEPEAVEGV